MKNAVVPRYIPERRLLNKLIDNPAMLRAKRPRPFPKHTIPKRGGPLYRRIPPVETYAPRSRSRSFTFFF